jgi:hypothetical protein
MHWKHSLIGAFLGAFGVASAVVACTSREFDNPETSAETAGNIGNAPPSSAAEVFDFHSGPGSQFDKDKNDARAELGLVSSNDASWVCASRPKVTICRGQNGAGKGSVLWVRYRGELNQYTNQATPIFARILVGTQLQSFSMRQEDGKQSYLLLTDGINQCHTSGSSDIYGGQAKSKCTQAPAQIKNYMKTIVDAGPGDWNVNVKFGITQQASNKVKPVVQMDAGTPEYSVTLPARLPEEEAPAEE